MDDLGLGELRRAIERVLEEFLAARREEFSLIEPEAVPVVDEVVRAVRSGGKRLRPAFCYRGFRAGGGSHGEAILAVAASLELLHTFALLHDDVMDRPRLRRGQLAAYLRLAQDHREAGRPGDPLQFGISVSMLAGDLALVLSDALFHDSGFEPGALARAAGPLYDLRIRAVAGQYLDLVGTGRPPDSATVRRIALLKTASYSVTGPLTVGAALAGASGRTGAVLARYGAALGEAFQLRDDVLGLFGDPEVTGKDAETDALQGKPTAVVAWALAMADSRERQAILDCWGNPEAADEQVDALKVAVRSSGALGAALDEIDRLVEEAKGALSGPAGAPLDRESVTVLRGLADLISTRSLPPSLAGRS